MGEAKERLSEAWLSCADSLTQKGRAYLLSKYGSSGAAFSAFSGEDLPALGEKAFSELRELQQKGLDKLELALQKGGIRIGLPTDPDFPDLLNQIPDPPSLLFYQGALQQHENAIAIVGSRRETRYGREQAYQIAKDLAQAGVTVVSGLARGIDTAAHQGALDGGGRTIGVLGSGIKRIYPKENGELAQRIVQTGGAIISEFAPTAEPLAFRFPFRNRLVSGLCQGVLLIEAREKSGTLITVGHALNQGREVFALPGQVDAPGSLVPHRMLREGARLITCAKDLLTDMNWPMPGETAQTALPLPDLTNELRAIYDALCDEPKDFGELIATTDLEVSGCNAALTTLELMGLIEPLPGRRFRRAR